MDAGIRAVTHACALLTCRRGADACTRAKQPRERRHLDSKATEADGHQDSGVVRGAKAHRDDEVVEQQVLDALKYNAGHHHHDC